MTFNLAENISYCREFVTEISGLLTYSHFLPVSVVLLLSFFVFFKTRFSKTSLILLLISITFTVWCLLNIAIWFNYSNSDLLMFAWAPIEIFSVLLFILYLYFVYIFINKKEPSLVYKAAWVLLLTPVALVPALGKYLTGYDIQECVAIENEIYLNYVSFLKIFFVGWIFFELFRNLPENKKDRIKNVILGIGVIFFTFSFYISGFISEQTENYKIELYGLYSMILFVGIMSYSIVRYSLFNIKLISAQALVVALSISVGSQFFFIEDEIGVYLNSVTLILIIVFGTFLVKNVKREIDAKNQIQDLASDLAKSNLKLKELDKQKTEFVSLASHQLRAPMTAIKGYSSLMLDGDFGEIPEKIKLPLQHIFTSTQSLIQIVGDFLDVTRIELGTMKFTYTDFDLKDLVRDVVGELNPNITISGIEFKLELQDDPMPMHGDEAKIKQVINNLIDNAIKYTKQGWVHARLQKLGNKYRFTVQDTGVGIAAGTLPKLFDKFIRAGNANEANVIGTGLGLYVAKQMVQKHNGKIWAESEGEGKGSTFIVEFDIAK